MGYLTTFTIYNDGIGLIMNKSKDFCEKLYRIAMDGKTQSFGHGSHANLVKVQKTRHADDDTIYVHMGNTLCEMNVHSRETDALLEEHPKFFEDMLSLMESNSRMLREKLNVEKVKKLKEKRGE